MKKTQSLRIMTRTGYIDMSGKKDSNQCANIGHPLYEYTARVLFHPDALLNERGFLIDHFDIDIATKVAVADSGSCEIMCKKILDSIESILKQKTTPYMGVKFTLKPVGVDPKDSGYFEEFRVSHQKYSALVMNL
ncbi:MAG: hypothetical protein R3B64_01205 [Candidatus Paceibacterota bacterium]